MAKEMKWATRVAAMMPLLVIALATTSFIGASATAVPSVPSPQATKKSASPLDGLPKGPPFPSHYFNRGAPALTIRHVSSKGGELNPPPPPTSTRHSRLHHAPHFPSSPIRRRPASGETAPPYAVQMEPLVQYSPRDPLYANTVDSEDDKGEKGDKRIAEQPNEPSQRLDEEKEDVKDDQEGGATIQGSQQAEEKSSSGHPVVNSPLESADTRRYQFQYPYHSLPIPSVYGQPQLHGPHHNQGPRYVILKEPEPIIEIIVKESNESLPAPPPPAAAPVSKPREPVQVFYVKYEKKKGKSGGDLDGVVYDTPIPANIPASPVPLPPVLLPEEVEGRKRASPTESPLPLYSAPPTVETTTLRAIIRPESEHVHHPHTLTKGLKISFGEERGNRKESEAVEEDQSAPQPSFVAPSPTWSGANGGQLPPFRQLPEQHFRGQQVTRFLPNPHQQQFNVPPAPTKQGQFPPPQRYESQAPDSRAFPPPSRSLPPQGIIPLSPNSFINGPSFRNGPGFPPGFYQDQQQQQQARLRQQHLQQFHHQQFQDQQQKIFQEQQKNFLQLQEQQKQQQALQNQRLPPPPFRTPSKPPPTSFHSGPRAPIPTSNSGHPPPNAPFPPPFIRLPTHQGERLPETSTHRLPFQADIVKSIPQLEQHHISSQFNPQQPLQQHNLRYPPVHPNPTISSQPQRHQQEGHPSQGVPQPSVDPQVHQSQQQGANNAYQQPPQYATQQFDQRTPQQGPQNPRSPGQFESNRPQSPSQTQSQRQPQQQGGQVTSGNNRYNNAQHTEQNFNARPIQQSHQQQYSAVNTSPTPGPSYGTTILHNPIAPISTAQQINSLGNSNSYSNTTPRPAPSTTPTTSTTTPQNIPDLPDEIPDDLRQQLLSSGILSNADIQILDYDKIGDIPIENLPPEALSGLAGSGLTPAASENKPVAVTAPQRGKGKTKEAVEMKVVRYTPGTEESAVGGLIRDDVEETKVLAPVTTSNENNSFDGYKRYLPLRISGERFPVPDVPELRGRNVTSVVVLAPVGFPTHGRERRADGEEIAEEQAGDLLSSGKLNTLVKNPSEKNFKEWLEVEKKSSPEEQAVVLLVSPTEEKEEEKGDIFMLDVGSGRVSQLRGELSAAFVQVAKENARDTGGSGDKREPSSKS